MDGQGQTGASTRHPFLQWWASHVAASVNRADVIAKVHEEAGWSAHYVFMTMMSAAIAVLGLLLASPAVVIGAMLISPLMGPIIGLGFGLAVFDAAEIRRTLTALALGVVLAVGFSSFIVLVSPLQTVTEEIAARTRPNLFDLLVALFSGLAGTYAMIRGRHGTIVGVAIATALMPPLAVIGFGLATANWTVFWGSSLLFLTNLMTIALAATILARLYGFAGHLSPRQTGLQATLVVITFLALGIPLLIALKQIAWEAVASRQSHDVIAAIFGKQSRLSEMAVDHDASPMRVEATVLTPNIQPGAEQEATSRLQEILKRRVEVTIDQFRVGAESDPEVAEIAVARGATTDRARSRLSERLALIAGVDASEVLIDGSAKQALVRANPIPGADFSVYRALEARVAASEPGWRVVLIPPIEPLSQVEFSDGAPTAAGAEAAATAAWAARRLGLAILVSGPATEAEALASTLTESGATAIVEERSGRRVDLEWMTARPVAR